MRKRRINKLESHFNARRDCPNCRGSRGLTPEQSDEMRAQVRKNVRVLKYRRLRMWLEEFKADARRAAELLEKDKLNELEFKTPMKAQRYSISPRG